MVSASELRNAPPRIVLPVGWTLADLHGHLGGIPLERIRLYPPPGMATLQDAIDVGDREDRLCELVDGVLVEKPMGTYESLVAVALAHYLHAHLETHPRGIVLGADGALQILPRKMRIPDVSFISWERFPNRQLPRTRVFDVSPDLAVEVLSEGNTPAEMTQKLSEYFQSRVQLVWYIEPKSRSATAYTAADQGIPIGEDGILDGQSVLPGFQLPLRRLFHRAEGTAESE